MAELTAADFAAQPDVDKLVVVDIEAARALEGQSWSYYDIDTYVLSALFTDGEIVRIVEDGQEYTEVFSIGSCISTASSFYLAFGGGAYTVYVHSSTGADPGGGSFASVMAYFYIGLSNRAVSLKRYRSMLTDGKLDRWTTSSNLTYWTEGISGTAALANNSTEVYDRFSAYSAKMTVGAAASYVYIYQDVVLRPNWGAMIRLKYKCASANDAPAIQFYNTGANTYLDANGNWQGSGTDINIPNSQNWAEYSLSFTTNLSYSSYRLLLKAQTNGDEIYWDNVEVLRFYEAAPFLPLLGEGALPSISHSVGTFVNPDDQLAFGTITMNDDGYFANAYSRFIWHNKKAYVKIGLSTSNYEDLAQVFYGLTRTPELSDGRFSIDIQDARAEFKDLLQKTFDSANYANCEDAWKEKPIPILLGAVGGIAPPCSNTAANSAHKFKVTQTVFPSANYALADVNAVYVGPRTNARIEGVWWSENLADGGFGLLRNREGQWVKCNATGYYSNWIDWLWFMLTEINGTLPDMINYRSFLDLATARGNLSLCRWYGDQVNIREAINQLKRSAQFFFYTRRTGEHCARALASSVPSDALRFYNEDLTGFVAWQDTADVYQSISVRYRENSDIESEKYAKAEEVRAGYAYGARDALIIDMVETTSNNAAKVAGYYADILKRPLESVRVTLPAQALFLEPTDKIYINKSVVDNDGVTQTLYANQAFVVMAIEKNLNAMQATVTAVKSENDFYWTA